MKITRIFRKWYFRHIVVYISICCACMNLLQSTVSATPSGASVAAGSADIVQSNNTTNVEMLSSQAVINWQSLDTSSNEVINFLRNSDFAVLNRVIEGGATQFDGSLFAQNGTVFIVNPNGIVFGPTAYIEAMNFVGSGLDIKDMDFMSGLYTFEGGHGAVINNGEINAQSVALHPHREGLPDE